MADPKPSHSFRTMPAQTPPSVSATLIAEARRGLSRAVTVAVPLAITAADAINESLPQLLAQVRASVEGAVAPEERDELAATASTLVTAGARLSFDLLTLAARGLDAVRQAVGTEPTEPDAPAGP
jgi:hypothetical protein